MNKQNSTRKTWRLDSIDILRGISIFLMIMAHTDWEWLQEGSMWLIGFKFLAVNYIGTSQFVFIAGLGFTYSWRKSQDSVADQNTVLRNSMSKTIVMFLVSFIFNAIAPLFRPSVGKVEGLWYMNILQVIALSRLLGILIVKFSIKDKILLYFSLVSINSILLWWMIPRIDTSFTARAVYYALFHPLSGDIFPVNFAFFVMGSAMGDVFYGIRKEMNIRIEKGFRPVKTRDRLRDELRMYVLLGISLVLLGITTGLYKTQMDHRGLIPEINTHPAVNVKSLWGFLSVHSHAWAFMCSGIQIILVTIFFYFLDYHHRSRKIWNLFYLYGRYSLTIYFSHYLLIIAPLAFDPSFSLNHRNIWPVKAFVYSVMYLFVSEIHKRSRGKFSFEFIIGVAAKNIFQYMEKRASTSHIHKTYSASSQKNTIYAKKKYLT